MRHRRLLRLPLRTHAPTRLRRHLLAECRRECGGRGEALHRRDGRAPATVGREATRRAHHRHRLARAREARADSTAVGQPAEATARARRGRGARRAGAHGGDDGHVGDDAAEVLDVQAGDAMQPRLRQLGEEQPRLLVREGGDEQLRGRESGDGAVELRHRHHRVRLERVAERARTAALARRPGLGRPRRVDVHGGEREAARTAHRLRGDEPAGASDAQAALVEAR